jgi:hypothetical protein
MLTFPVPVSNAFTFPCAEKVLASADSWLSSFADFRDGYGGE